MYKNYYAGTNYDLTEGIPSEYLNFFSEKSLLGFKFTSSTEVADFESSNIKDTPYFKGENITPVVLKSNKAIKVNKDNESTSPPITKYQIYKIINHLSKKEITTILNDYYGEVKYSGYDKLLREAILSYENTQPHYCIKCLKNDFFDKYNEEDFLKIIKEETEYDSIIKEEYAGHKNIYVFSTEQIYSAIDKKQLTITQPNLYVSREQESIKSKEIDNQELKNLIKAATKYKTYKEFQEDVLFHGTGEDFKKEELSGGGYDNLIWTAKTNVIAQTYIPLAEVTSSYYLPETEYEKERVANVFNNENSFDIKIAKQMGYKFEFTKENQEISSVSCTFKGRISKLPRKKDIANYLINNLGYENNKYMKIKYKYEKGKEKIANNNYKAQGRLFIMLGAKKLNFKDNRIGFFNEDNPEYHNLEGFRKAKQEGYDGVIINDALQSENYGNLGHDGYALFEETLKKLDIYTIPATNFDFEEELNVQETEDFSLKEIFEKSRNIIKNKRKIN